MAAIALIAIAVGTATAIHHRAARQAVTLTAACGAKTTAPPRGVTDAYDRDVLSLGPAIYLTLGHPSARTETDLSGHGHTGTYMPADSNPGTAILPNGDRAAQFNGSSQYLQVPSSSALSVTHTKCLTVQAWVRPKVHQFPHEEGTGYVYILGKGSPGKQEYALRIYSEMNSEVPPRPNRVSAYVFNLSGGEGSGSYFQDPVSTSTWTMITFVIDDQPTAGWPDGYVAIYKNNTLRGQVSITQFNVNPRASTAPLCIATRNLDSYFEGAIGKVAVFDYVLSAQQVDTIYEAMRVIQGANR